MSTPDLSPPAATASTLSTSSSEKPDSPNSMVSSRGEFSTGSETSLSETSLDSEGKKRSMGILARGSPEPSKITSNLNISPLSQSVASLKPKTSEPSLEDNAPTSMPEFVGGQVSSPPQGNFRSPHGKSAPRKSWFDWFQAFFAVIGLITTLTGLVFYASRSYEMAVWTTHNDEIQTCASLGQLQNTVLTSRCKELIANGTTEPPYGAHTHKIFAPAVAVSRLARRAKRQFPTTSTIRDRAIDSGDQGDSRGYHRHFQSVFILMISIVVIILLVTGLRNACSRLLERGDESINGLHDGFAPILRHGGEKAHISSSTHSDFYKKISSKVAIPRHLHRPKSEYIGIVASLVGLLLFTALTAPSTIWITHGIISPLSISAISVSIAVAIGAYFLAFLRHNTRTEPPFQSQARSQVPIGHRFPNTDPQTFQGQAVAIKHNPEDQHHPVQLRQRLVADHPHQEVDTKQESRAGLGPGWREEAEKYLKKADDVKVPEPQSSHPKNGDDEVYDYAYEAEWDI